MALMAGRVVSGEACDRFDFTHSHKLEMTVHLALRAFVSMTVLPVAVIAHAENWPQFRGPRSDGMVDAAQFPWSGMPRRIFDGKYAIPGRVGHLRLSGATGFS